MSGAGTVRSKEWSAKVGQSGDPEMRGKGTTGAASPAWRVFVHVMVIRAPELLNVMLLLESMLREEKVRKNEKECERM